MSNETNESNESKEAKEKSGSAKLLLAALAVTASFSLLFYQFIQTNSKDFPARSFSSVQHANQSILRDTDDGRQLLWAGGPSNGEGAEWFDVTDSPLKPQGYQHGIGKDSIPAIDQPKFVAIRRRKELLEYGINDDTPVIGYAHKGEAKAYPIAIMDHHELVNDFVGGKPVTVGW